MSFTVNDNLSPDAPINGLKSAINLLASQVKRLSGGNSWQDLPSSNIVGWREVEGIVNAKSVDKIRVNGTATINLPINPINSDVEILTTSFQSICNINFNGNRYKQLQVTGGRLSGINKYTRLVFVNLEYGWVDVSNTEQLSISSPSLIDYLPGSSLWIENGELQDKSGLGRDLRAVINGQEPISTVGLDNRNVLRWLNESSKALYTLPFLDNAIGATIYVVFTVEVPSSYNVIQTSALDDYWYYRNNGNGYIGTFLNARREAYPPDMPASGNHLVSIHVSQNTYQVCVDNFPKAVLSTNFVGGNLFVVRPDNYRLIGDIALVLVYPEFMSLTSEKHVNNLAAIKANYPSLPFTLQ